MVEPELTEVGELHSLTDWQVSEASEEAELDEFCSRNWGGVGGGSHEGTNRIQTICHQKINNKSKREIEKEREKERGRGGKEHTERQTQRRGKDGRSRKLGLFSPSAAPHTDFQALTRKHEMQ